MKMKLIKVSGLVVKIPIKEKKSKMKNVKKQQEINHKEIKILIKFAGKKITILKK